MRVAWLSDFLSPVVFSRVRAFMKDFPEGDQLKNRRRLFFARLRLLLPESLAVGRPGGGARGGVRGGGDQAGQGCPLATCCPAILQGKTRPKPPLRIDLRGRSSGTPALPLKSLGCVSNELEEVGTPTRRPGRAGDAPSSPTEMNTPKSLLLVWSVLPFGSGDAIWYNRLTT